MSKHLFTIGDSNHPLDRILALLAQHKIEALVDIRRFPGSRKHPDLNQETLASSVRVAGVDYHWFEPLGGRRSKQQGWVRNLIETILRGTKENRYC